MKSQIQDEKLSSYYNSIQKDNPDEILISFDIENLDENQGEPLEDFYNNSCTCKSFKEFLLWIIENIEDIENAVKNEFPWYRLSITIKKDGEVHHPVMLEGNEQQFRSLSIWQYIGNLMENQSKNLLDKMKRIKEIIDEREPKYTDKKTE